MKRYTDKKAICPFYKNETPGMICCFSFDENSTIHLAFSDRAECKAYKNKHCRTDYKNCKIYFSVRNNKKEGE